MDNIGSKSSSNVKFFRLVKELFYDYRQSHIIKNEQNGSK